MMDFSLEQNDLEINNGDICLCPNDVEATAQVITIRLKTLAGEWFLDTTIGIPYLTQILGKKRNDRFLRRLVAKEIRSVSGIKELSDFSFDEGSVARSVAIKFKVSLSDQSIISINESIGV